MESIPPVAMANTPRGRNVFADPVAAFSAGRFGMLLLLASLGMLFAASILGYIILRLQAIGELDATPALPRELWISTLLLLISSGTMHLALVAVRANRRVIVSAALVASFLLGLAFLGSQWLAWKELLAQHESIWDQVADVPRYMIASFYVLTSLHAAHVVGGLVPMTFVTLRSLRGRYGPTHHAGVFYCGMYWHFLGVVWLILFATLLLGS